ncbi:MAG TPA: hypothetical protein VK437_13560 [Steroidobacteraceae bacterium]|nr:hypothetical protein [Steroidobacteraceae bacterium]
MLPRMTVVLRHFARASLGGLAALALAACNGTAVVTLTSTPSTDTFLAYRVGLVSIELQTGSGRTVASTLPAGTTVDLARLVNLSEIVGASSVAQGDYKQVIVTLDYGSAQIIYDDGSVAGVALTPLAADGQAMGQVTLTLYLDPSNEFPILRHSASRLSLEFDLGASNLVNLTQRTVTVTPLMAASAMPIDSKVVHIRGPLGGASTSSSVFSTGIVPFDFGTAGTGSLQITPSSVTTYEINGAPSTGTAGLTQLASLSPGVMTEAFGNLATSTDTSSTATDTGTTTTCSDGSTPTTVNGAPTCPVGATLVTSNDNSTSSTTSSTQVSFAATQVLAGSSVQGSGFDHLSGIVTGRSGNTLTLDDGTLIAEDGTNTFIFGTAIVNIGANTQVTQFGAGSSEANALAQISVGSLIDAFGTASDVGSNSATLDASAGRVRLSQSTASGIVAGVGTTGGTLTLDLATLGGRSVSVFDFLGTGTSPSVDASAALYQVTTGNLDLTNSTVGSPVQVTGYVTAFGAAPPDFSAQTLLDYTTINAELALNWAGGTPAPFASYDTSQIDVDAQNSSIGPRALIQTGAQTVDIVGIASDPLIVPNSSANTVYTIGHSLSGTFENFNTFTSFITQLQTELNGTALATALTAFGQYTTSTYTFSASSVTLTLNN